jgi:hypothetical protein
VGTRASSDAATLLEFEPRAGPVRSPSLTPALNLITRTVSSFHLHWSD